MPSLSHLPRNPLKTLASKDHSHENTRPHRAFWLAPSSTMGRWYRAFWFRKQASGATMAWSLPFTSGSVHWQQYPFLSRAVLSLASKQTQSWCSGHKSSTHHAAHFACARSTRPSLASTLCALAYAGLCTCRFQRQIAAFDSLHLL